MSNPVIVNAMQDAAGCAKATATTINQAETMGRAKIDLKKWFYFILLLNIAFVFMVLRRQPLLGWSLLWRNSASLWKKKTPRNLIHEICQKIQGIKRRARRGTITTGTTKR